tara:strand:+ start:46 stop:216 length:171 start_codon:yes stop_codon:yes gene_type:complete
MIFILCLAGCSWQSYAIGKKNGLTEGTEKALEILHEQKIISFDEKGNIVPNPFFNS